LQADGGTRTAAITGGYVALALAVRKLRRDGALGESPLKTSVAAVSVGVDRGRVLLDLCYEEDARAEVDMNVVMTGDGRLVEVQASGEEATFTAEQLQTMLRLAARGIRQLTRLQRAALRHA
ncbi:MAG: ribonuclease PH, partial [Bryobacterales bacterium]|nr:ribonuclease PH [Bryobacterales bacterium]